MAFDLTGITNENEFYTHHYLSAILENDLKDVFSEWKRKEDEEGIAQPYKGLRGLRKEFFGKQGLLEREKNIEERLSLQREFIAQLLSVLGYDYHNRMVELDHHGSIPLSGGINRADGSPELWIIEAASIYGEDGDPLESHFVPEQYPPDDDIQKILDIPMEEIVTRQVFGRSEPPRWVILVNCAQVILLDRTKWHEKRLLRFDLREILDRRETTTLQATAALLHRDSICPEDGMPLLDTLDENSHKHAFAVSEDLKYSLREAIELLGNEAVYYLSEQLHEKIYGRDMAGQLTRECLRYMYRLLFLFYIEARPELGYLPDKSPQFRKGYSLESLRDLEMVKLTTDESRNGFFIHESIQALFDLLYNGFQQEQMDVFGSPDHDTFRMAPLRSHLFDPARTPILKRVKFRNSVLQKVIELMSLSRPKRGRNNRRGRISYKQLGINQLGAVYEALLSYQGFFAETDLYEVKKAGENHNVLDTAYFVKPEDLEQYTEDERVYNDNGTLVKYDKGTFIYRLAGRDREKSASYYTPEVLTQCLVKYALKELLKDKTADEILELTVCEPAMGSAAFLNEAVNQLSKAYLDLKQKETGQTISHDDYPKELQKVKMYIADNNVYGVDLNPVAVELAEVSLWLNTIYEGGFVPWFGMQLVCGNSLIGARRQVFYEGLLRKKTKNDPLWLDEVPQRVMPGEKRENDTVYHFLLPDKGMADYQDKVIKQMATDEIRTINEWRKEFTKPFSNSEISQLKKLSDAVDNLWQRHAEMQRDIDNRTTDPLYVFGQKEPKDKRQPTTTEFKDRIFQQEMFSENVRNSSPYRRLKLVMDYWCALWFWPIEKADLLPSRAEFLFDLTLSLEGNLFDADVDEKGQQLLFPDTRPKQMSLDMVDEFGYVNVDKLCKENKRLCLVKGISERYRYLHWELEFAELVERRQGFDLVLGNPPWIKVNWNEGGILGDAEPVFVLRKFSASELSNLREKVLNVHNLQSTYFKAFEEAEGIQNFLNGYQNYSILKGIQTNLFKCFLPQSWMIAKIGGVNAFLHPEGVYDDPKGGKFREELYARLKAHFQFQNAFILFPIAHRSRFSINIYQNIILKGNISFIQIANLFTPSTVDACFDHSGHGAVLGIKDSNNKWNVGGHKQRILQIGESELSLFVNLYDIEGTPSKQARLPAIHSREMVEVLKKFATHPKRIEDISGHYCSSVMWDETNSVKKDHTIRRETQFPESAEEAIFSGPHIYVGNPFNKTPRNKCTEKAHYDVIDLSKLPEDYLPRTNYLPNIDHAEYIDRIPKVPWKSKKSVTEYYRLASRFQLPSANEHTLVSAIIPQKVGHINTCLSIAFEDPLLLVTQAGFFHSLCMDFYVKTTGRGALPGLIKTIPVLEFNRLIAVRALLLNCLTNHYADLWACCWNKDYSIDRWAKTDSRLNNSCFTNISNVWNRTSVLRMDYERRQARVELDALSAMTLGLKLNELIIMYRVQFPVLKQYESDTWYDRFGRIVFTNNSQGLPNVGFSRTEWNDLKDMKSGSVERTIVDDTMPGGPRERTIAYEAPFDRCDREKDYEIVWAEFERRFKEQEGKA